MNKKLITKIHWWNTDEIILSKWKIYIEKYESSPLELVISFYSAMKKNKTRTGFMNMLTNFGLALTTVEDAPISINAVEITNVMGNTSDIMFILQEQYISRVKKNLFWILGSTSLIGNPIMLANSFGTGIKEFF